MAELPAGASADEQRAGSLARVGPKPGPPPAHLDTWTVLDLLATARRWRVHEPFVAGQTDGLSLALVACLNAGQPVPRWLREALLSFLLEALWERPPRTGHPTSGGAASPDDELAELLRHWREPGSGRGQLG
ncbi:MAG: hypothetical protein ACRDI2_24625 [Chloroflexota bacterium]